MHTYICTCSQSDRHIYIYIPTTCLYLLLVTSKPSRFLSVLTKHKRREPPIDTLLQLLRPQAQSAEEDERRPPLPLDVGAVKVRGRRLEDQFVADRVAERAPFLFASWGRFDGGFGRRCRCVEAGGFAVPSYVFDVRDGRGDEVDVCLDHGRDIGERRLGAQDHEEVGEPRHRDAHVGAGPADAGGPVLVECGPVAALDV